jgi:hypothetical protein
VSLEKIWRGQMGRLEEKIAAALLYWLHSFPLACLIFSLLDANKIEVNKLERRHLETRCTSSSNV